MCQKIVFYLIFSFFLQNANIVWYSKRSDVFFFLIYNKKWRPSNVHKNSTEKIPNENQELNKSLHLFACRKLNFQKLNIVVVWNCWFLSLFLLTIVITMYICKCICYICKITMLYSNKNKDSLLANFSCLFPLKLSSNFRTEKNKSFIKQKNTF